MPSPSTRRPRNQQRTRYFGAAVDEVVRAAIDIDWIAPDELSVAVIGGGHRLDWRMSLTSSNATRLMNSLGSVLPDSWWRSHRFLAVMSRLIPPILHTGHLRLSGITPNGQRFAVNPSLTWLIEEATATLDGSGLGDVGPAPTQGKLGDFRVPQRGIFAIGRAFFERVVDANTRRSSHVLHVGGRDAPGPDPTAARALAILGGAIIGYAERGSWRCGGRPGGRSSRRHVIMRTACGWACR